MDKKLTYGFVIISIDQRPADSQFAAYEKRTLFMVMPDPAKRELDLCQVSSPLNNETIFFGTPQRKNTKSIT